MGRRRSPRNRLSALPQLSNCRAGSGRTFNAVFRRPACLIKAPIRRSATLPILPGPYHRRTDPRSVFRPPFRDSHSHLHNEVIKYFACIPRTAQICDNLRQLSRLDRHIQVPTIPYTLMATPTVATRQKNIGINYTYFIQS